MAIILPFPSRHVGGVALVDSLFDNDHGGQTALSSNTMMIRTGNLFCFTALAVATGTSYISKLPKVVMRENLHVVTTILERKVSSFIYGSSKVWV